MPAKRIKSFLRRMAERTLGIRASDVAAIHGQIERLERSLEFVAVDEDHRWLFVNRRERMDATVSLFDPMRRQFHLDRYSFAASRTRSKRVLDCACGTGYGVRLLREIGGATRVVGVDIDTRTIDYARAKHMPEGTEYVCAPADALPVEKETFEVVTSFETIEHVPDDTALLGEFHRVLQSNGLLIISTPNQWPVEISPHHCRTYSRESFSQVLVQAGFELVEFWNQNSGTKSPYNHGRERGMAMASAENESSAECYVAVCRRT